ncbi:MAG: AIR carboxylase family protein, partial [Acidimicrobiales bacterium]
DALDGLEIPHLRRVGSAHRGPEHVLALLRRYDSEDVPTVFITVAGMSDALSGLADAAVSSPVIACPPASGDFSGLDVLSSLRTPPGVAPMVELDPTNAALGAAKILGLCDPELRARVGDYQARRAEAVIRSDPGESQ